MVFSFDYYKDTNKIKQQQPNPAGKPVAGCVMIFLQE
jgi:hypothetical protein